MRALCIILSGLVVIGLALPLSAKKKIQLRVDIAKSDVDLTGRTVHFRLNKPAKSSNVKVYSPEGALLAKASKTYHGAMAGDRLSISWPSLGANKDNFRLALKVTDTDNYWVTWEIVRFYVEIPHEDVVFETGKWNILPSETHKLDASLTLLKSTVKKHSRTVPCQIYVAGFTDTVGKVEDNRKLSQKRARAIAKYFTQRGLTTIPIFARGFGEEVLAIGTGDDVPEEKNRRAVYVVSTFPPDIPGPGTWKQVR
ncbi:MAG: OmpA family protein [Proteobacteria bacterium]|nr:OmpA family protein [Pseudomonadota bacterium]